jgi:hypothetical protein
MLQPEPMWMILGDLDEGEEFPDDFDFDHEDDDDLIDCE